MRRPSVIFATLALFLGASLLVLWGMGLGPIEGWIPVASFATAIFVTLALAALAALGEWRARRSRDERFSAPQAIPDFSFPSVLAGIAIASMGLGLELGPWLIQIGAGGLGVAAASAGIELRASRRDALRAEEEGAS